MTSAGAFLERGDRNSTASSGQQSVHLGQEPGEVELGGASSPGGIEIGIVPVALMWRERGIGFTGVLASAMMLVVGKEASQVTQARVRARRQTTPAVTFRTHRRTAT